MHALLLSHGISAVPAFINAHIDQHAAPARIGYLDDAARPFGDAPFVTAERARIAALGYPVDDLTASEFSSAAAFAAALDAVDVLYVAGGNTFVLLEALRHAGADTVIVERVRGGMPYIGSSAGSIVTGPNLEPATLMDDPADAPGLTDRRGLGLIDTVVIPHADGALPPYPPELIARITSTFGDTSPLTLLTDAQALLVDGTSTRLIDSP